MPVQPDLFRDVLDLILSNRYDADDLDAMDAELLA